jgi:biopolymer transport protein ExbB/TolQ
VGFLISAKHALSISREIDDLSSGVPTAHEQMQSSQGAFRLRMAQRIAPVRHIANTLVLLGLIGTVLGFIIALSGVDPDTVSDVNSIAPMVSVLIQGMSTALYTTLIGSILNVWLMANYQILTGGTVQLISQWLDQADEDA